VTKTWRKINREEFHDLLSSLYNNSRICVWPRALSRNASLTILCISAALLPSLKQNLMQIRYDRKTALTRHENAQKKKTQTPKQHSAAWQTDSQMAHDT
jgi:molybdopterin-guanine dinucleotide biosynthesis protein A